ncbi:UNVERIFIED_CONTAM: hypothetical protein Sradi_6891600 [Sesamum radiatum]|uniref:Reverse transcriptase domain-containing protein n=1 Tax=Sesamum radiatum TaxID=300843 RepID=A0AAW2JHW9_SESRA
MELFHVLLHLRIDTAGDFQYHWKCADLRIVNLCFADDVLLFCAGDIPSVRRLREVFEEFAELSGLQINPGKSTVILSRAVQGKAGYSYYVRISRRLSSNQISWSTLDSLTSHSGRLSAYSQQHYKSTCRMDTPESVLCRACAASEICSGIAAFALGFGFLIAQIDYKRH